MKLNLKKLLQFNKAICSKNVKQTKLKIGFWDKIFSIKFIDDNVLKITLSAFFEY